MITKDKKKITNKPTLYRKNSHKNGEKRFQTNSQASLVRGKVHKKFFKAFVCDGWCIKDIQSQILQNLCIIGSP